MAAHPLANQSNVSMSAVNAPWSGQAGFGPLTNTTGPTYSVDHNNTFHFSVEKVDNGFVLRSAARVGDFAKVKIAKDVEELKDLFIQSLVEHRMEK